LPSSWITTEGRVNLEYVNRGVLGTWLGFSLEFCFEIIAVICFKKNAVTAIFFDKRATMVLVFV